MTGENHQKSLSQRWHRFYDGRGSPRDLYSSFLLEHADAGYHRPNLDACFEDFDAFYEASQAMIAEWHAAGINVLNSGF